MSSSNNVEYDKVTIIIPAFNEQEGIRDTLTELKSNEKLKVAEIIVIDDGSTDSTFDMAKKVAGVKVIRHKVNLGYGSAIKTGTRHARGSIIAWYDADGQHRPEDLIKVVDTLVEEELDYCIGVRGKDSYVEKSRVLGKKILRMIVDLLAREKMGDFNSGLRAFRTEILKRYLGILPKRFGASTVTTFIMQEQRYLGKEVPIIVNRRVGKSSVKQIRDGLQTISLILNIMILFRPKEVFGTLGVGTILVGSGYGVMKALIMHNGIPSLSVIIIVLGIQIFFFGVISAQISQLRLERING